MRTSGDERVSHPPPIHENAELCRYLLRRITTAWPLLIAKSTIPGAGTGLFARNRIDEGEEIFRSQPLVSCVAEAYLETVCDYCFKDSTSRVHPGGRFRSQTDEVPTMIACPRCGKGNSYCSQSCRQSAWNSYHQYECEALSGHRPASPRLRALYRILSSEKAGVLSEDDWSGLSSLESHISSYSDGLDEDVRVATSATGTDLPEKTVLRLYCAILTNTTSMRDPSRSQTIGSALDVTMSLMNHSCDPNVSTVFEGSELRMRSLRTIEPGDELLQCYADASCDVLMRRPRLEDQFHFTCSCPRCEAEMDAHRARAAGDEAYIENVRQAQEKMTELVNNTISDLAQSGDGQAARRLEEAASALATNVFIKEGWPDALDPMPLLHKRLATIYVLEGKPIPALQNMMKGCAHTERRLGEAWAHDLRDLVQILGTVVQPRGRPAFEQDGFPTAKQFWMLRHGYMYMHWQAVEKTFGPDTLYTRASRKWLDDAVEGVHEGLCPGHEGFGDGFREAHAKLLAWAGGEPRRWVVTVEP